MEFADSHCHLNYEGLAGRSDAVVAAMRAAGVTRALNICTTMEEAPTVLDQARRYPQVWASVGVHPDYDEVIAEPTVDDLVRHAQDPKVVAIGETGLDYYRLEGDLEWQRDRFRTHIRAARTLGLPLIIHTRSAAEDTLRILREERADAVGGVMHCFTENLDVARAAIDLGFLISLSGIVTFKNAHQVHEVATEVPLEHLMIETDAPFLAPVPHRGKVNEPAWVVYVAARIAELKGVSVADVAAATSRNFMGFVSRRGA
ncbi:MAG: hypothetical protein RLZZ344_1359 [Pseudomonadota bacterium]|jgi:TatD DNase family protein